MRSPKPFAPSADTSKKQNALCQSRILINSQQINKKMSENDTTRTRVYGTFSHNGKRSAYRIVLIFILFIQKKA